MKKILFLILTIFLLISAGCTNVEPQMSTMQIREMTTKEINGNYKMIFKAVMTVLQDQDYIISNADFDSGLIVCQKQVEKSQANKSFIELFYVVNSSVNISATVTELNKTTSKVRLNIQEKTITYDDYNNMEKITNIKTPEIYNTLFNQIKIEVERLKAIK